MISVRRGVFETNSSSTHSITMCSENEYEKWKKGEMLFDRWNDKLIAKEEYQEEYENKKREYLEKYPEETERDFKEYFEDDRQYMNYDEFWDYIEVNYETFHNSYTTKNGEKVIVFGYFGYDG